MQRDIDIAMLLGSYGCSWFVFERWYKSLLVNDVLKAPCIVSFFVLPPSAVRAGATL